MTGTVQVPAGARSVSLLHLRLPYTEMSTAESIAVVQVLWNDNTFKIRSMADLFCNELAPHTHRDNTHGVVRHTAGV